MQTQDVEKLMQKIGYRFQDIALVKTALTHSSYANEHRLPRRENNERLEYLGDAVLELTVSEYLFQTKPDMPEGEMTKLRAKIVCESTLFLCAKKFGLGDHLLLGKGEEGTGGRKRPSIVSDAMEALIGAIYLDGGFEDAKSFIHRLILKDIDRLQLFSDSKTILQEIVQGMDSGELSYRLVEEKGPDHSKTFLVEALVGEEVLGSGSGHTKKAAEQEAAYHAIMKMKNRKGTDA